MASLPYRIPLLAASLVSFATLAPAHADLTAVNTAVEHARSIAADDPYLQQTFALQCHEPDENGTPITAEKYQFGGAPVAPTQLFDNLYYIGDTSTGSFLITTSNGYIMIDAGFGNGPETLILPAMQELGLDPAKIKYILITHPGPDHLGGAKYFQDTYGTQIVMSSKDWENVTNAPERSWINSHLPGREPVKFWAGPPTQDISGEDGMTLTLGDVTITMVATPRSARGGALSYIAPVQDKGETRLWATYGATGEPNSASEFALYQASVQHISEVAKTMGVEAITSNHPFVDGSVARMQSLKDRPEDAANPFVIGQDGVNDYLAVLGACASVWVARDAAGLNTVGAPK